MVAVVLAVCLSVTTAGKAADDPHADLFATTSYPSAVQCGACHPKVFSEWAASNHAYASISPMFHKFEQAINTLASGTIGSFCVRCHQQVGTQRGEPREAPLWERSAIAREGVTCITCHRVKDQFGKVNGERQIVPGDINKPIYNAGTGNELANVLADPDEYGISTKPGQSGRPIHGPVVKFEQISKSEFCVSCHQVAVHPGIKLEVVWDQYRDSPAARSGVTCQECHMGKVPGEAKGFDTWPIAIVNGKVVGSADQKHSNHMFHGPGYPIAHPGLFPFNPKSLRWEIREWLAFDYRSEWGKPDWEKKLSGREVASPSFPAPWQTQEARTAAREVLDQNISMLEDKRQSRIAVMENGSRIDGPFFDSPPKLGERLKFRYRVTNVDTGHNLPSGSLGAQPEIWLNVVLLDPDGKRVFESGYVDGNGDMADLHSLEVAAGKIKLDDQLFNLQSKF
ncbi:MAG: multiheme c-type cytochrome, partial [Ferrovibrio sp.]